VLSDLSVAVRTLSSPALRFWQDEFASRRLVCDDQDGVLGPCPSVAAHSLGLFRDLALTCCCASEIMHFPYAHLHVARDKLVLADSGQASVRTQTHTCRVESLHARPAVTKGESRG
jgi:hypothetical protein